MPVQLCDHNNASGHHQADSCLGHSCVVGVLVGVGQPGNYDRGPRPLWNGPGRVAHWLLVHEARGSEMGCWDLRVSCRVRQLGPQSHQSCPVVEICLPMALSILVVSKLHTTESIQLICSVVNIILHGCISKYSSGLVSIRIDHFFCTRSRGWTRHYAWVESPVMPRSARSQSTLRVLGACPTTASKAKTLSISIIPRPFRSKQSNHVIFKAKLSAVKWAWPAPSRRCLPQRVRHYTRMITSQRKTNVSTTTSRTHVKKIIAMNTFHYGLKA